MQTSREVQGLATGLSKDEILSAAATRLSMDLLKSRLGYWRCGESYSAGSTWGKSTFSQPRLEALANATDVVSRQGSSAEARDDDVSIAYAVVMMFLATKAKHPIAPPPGADFPGYQGSGIQSKVVPEEYG